MSRPSPARRHYAIDLVPLLGKGEPSSRSSTARSLPKKRTVIRETVLAFLEAAKSGALVHRLEGETEDRKRPWCAICRRYGAKPMKPSEARIVRELVERAGLSDRVAYAFASTRIIVLDSQAFRVCPCDLRAWREACSNYTRMGRIVAWQTIGLRKDLLL